MKDDEFLYTCRPPMRQAFEQDLWKRLTNLPYGESALPESTSRFGQIRNPQRYSGKWRSMVAAWVSLLSIVVVGGLTIWIAWRALPGATPTPDAMSPIPGVQIPTTKATEGKASEIVPTKQPPQAGPKVEKLTATNADFLQVRVSGMGRMVHHVLDVSPKGDQLLVYAANLQASGTGATVVDSIGDLLYITDLDGNLVVRITTLSKVRATAPYVTAYWHKENNRIIFIDQDDQGPGIFSVNADGSDRKRLTSPAETPLWLLPSYDGSHIFWQEGAWQTDETLILSQGKVARLGFFYQTSLDGAQSTRIWEGLEDYDLVLDQKAEIFAAYPRENCQDLAKQADPACLTLSIYDVDGVVLEELQFSGLPRYFTWILDHRQLLIGVLGNDESGNVQQFSKVDLENGTKGEIQELDVRGSDYWLPAQISFDPESNGVLFYHTEWNAPRILDFNTGQILEITQLAPPVMCQTPGRCPDLSWIPVPSTD